MRRALLKSWPALTRFYGGAVTPWTMDQMTVDELRAYIDFYNQTVKAQNEANRKR